MTRAYYLGHGRIMRQRKDAAGCNKTFSRKYNRAVMERSMRCKDRHQELRRYLGIHCYPRFNELPEPRLLFKNYQGAVSFFRYFFHTDYYLLDKLYLALHYFPGEPA